jgi:hypothetical protein
MTGLLVKGEEGQVHVTCCDQGHPENNKRFMETLKALEVYGNPAII